MPVAFSAASRSIAATFQEYSATFLTPGGFRRFKGADLRQRGGADLLAPKRKWEMDWAEELP